MEWERGEQKEDRELTFVKMAEEKRKRVRQERSRGSYLDTIS